uniref:Uncharacterized protein LOC107420568 n=1 Tax=Rhizophora mucronata TaxID=61149 RepID=A0A2P2JL58_RHIMU
MSVMKEVRVAWIVMMITMISNSTAGMELYKDSFNVLSTKCSIVDPFEQFSLLFFFFA